jgi:predicted ester cyclase
MTAQDNVALVRSLLDLYNSHQSDPAWLDKSLDLIAEDCEVIDVPSGMTSHGLDGYKQVPLFFASAFPGGRVEITNLFATEDQAVVEFIGRGTNTGPLHLPTGELPPTGRSAELPFCEVYRIRGGKIVSYHIYYDALSFMQQLDLNPSQQ